MMHVFTIMLVIVVVLLTATIFIIGLTVARELRNLRLVIEGAAPGMPSVHEAIMAVLERSADRGSSLRYDDGDKGHG